MSGKRHLSFGGTGAAHAADVWMDPSCEADDEEIVTSFWFKIGTLHQDATVLLLPEMLVVCVSSLFCCSIAALS